MPRTLPLIPFLIALSGIFASPVLAQFHQSDVVVRVSNSKLETGWYSPCLLAPAFPHRIFVTRFGSFDTINDPGFDSFEGALPPNTQIGFDIVSALRIWNGTDFSQIAQPRIRVRLGPPSNSRLTPLADTLVAGFGFTTSSTGLYHFHFNYTLLSQATPPISPAESGVYLLAMRLWANNAAIASSEPFWIIFNQNVSNEDATLAAEAFAAANNLELNCTTPPACLADINADGTVDGADFVGFVNSFSVGDPTVDAAGDINADSIIDGDDFVMFINAFAAGC